jgi:hypothetical protein
MCVNLLINKQMCKKDCQAFGSLGIFYNHTFLCVDNLPVGTIPVHSSPLFVK